MVGRCWKHFLEDCHVTLLDENDEIENLLFLTALVRCPALACLKMSRTREAPTPTKSSMNSEAEDWMKGTPASPGAPKQQEKREREKRKRKGKNRGKEWKGKMGREDRKEGKRIGSGYGKRMENDLVEKGKRFGRRPKASNRFRFGSSKNIRFVFLEYEWEYV